MSKSKTRPDEIALDTSVVVQIFKNDASMKKRVAGVETIWLPAPVIAEIAVGFSGARPSTGQQREFNTFLANSKTINCDREVALKYGTVHRLLRRKGSAFPINDIWIAACCLVHEKPLATKDAHFLRIPELKIEMW